jgi:hypothetical protein
MLQLRKFLSAIVLAASLFAAQTAAAASGLSPPPTATQIAAVHAAALRIPAPLRARFALRFAAWRKIWDEPSYALSSNTRTVTHTKEFRALLALGKGVLPAVVEELIDSRNFFALQLYDALQTDPRLKAVSTEDAYAGEQARARRTVRLYADSLRALRRNS